MYHTCESNDFCNYNLFSTLVIINGTHSTPAIDAITTETSTTPTDSLLDRMSKNSISTTPATKQYYYIDMSYSSTRSPCGNGAYSPYNSYSTSAPVPCKSAAFSLNAKFFSIMINFLIFSFVICFWKLSFLFSYNKKALFRRKYKKLNIFAF